MNLPNQITIARLFLTLLFVASLSSGLPGSDTVALALFVAAALTDYIDGELARRLNLITDFGKLMDPLVDKILTASAFILLAAHKTIPAWIAILFISRDFLITGLRLLALSNGKVLGAETLGKHKTAWQMVAAIFFLATLAAQDWKLDAALRGFHAFHTVAGNAILAIAATLTVWSGAGYVWNNRAVIRTR